MPLMENATFDDDDPRTARPTKKLRKDPFVYPDGIPLLLLLVMAPVILERLINDEGIVDT